MNRFSRYTQFFILLLLLPFVSYSFSDDLEVEFKGNFIHFNIKIPENHRIYASKKDSLSINLEDSTNLQKYEIILPKPLIKSGFNKITRFYENDLDIKVALTPWDESNPIHVRGDIAYEICNGECIKKIKAIDIADCYICDSYIFNILLFALLGGFILNFMPCVLPVLSLKIFSLLKTKEDYRNELIFSILGIFSVFWILASSSVILKAFGLTFGIGLHFQEPIFIIFLTSLMTIFVSKIMNGMDFTLPSFLANMNFKSSYLNSFISGAIAAIFSTPCTAPFLGTAIAFAAASEALEIFLIFSFIALGFSIPYILLILKPSLLRFLPKPGKWMEKMKLFLAVLMIATIFWLLSILEAQLGFRATFGVILLLMLIKFISEQKMKPIWKICLYLLILFCLFNLPLNASREDYHKEQEMKELWQEFTEPLLKKSLDEGKIVVIDITADWCGSCKYNKFMVWNREQTVKLLSNDNIIAMRKDITSRSLETQRFMQSIGVYGIPFNMVLGPEAPAGIILPTILSFDDLKRALEKAGL